MLALNALKDKDDCTGYQPYDPDGSQFDFELDKLLIDDPTATYIAYADGDSANDIGIYSGDLLIICRADKPQNNDLIVANLNGTFVLKVIDIINNKLLSPSKNQPSYTLVPGDEFQIEGVVTRAIRLHRPMGELK